MLLSSPRAQVAIIETEALLGLWLMTGLYVRAARWIALSFFGVLASVSLYLAFLGESSCGCFGRVQVNPWFSFAIDVSAILALWRWRAQSGSYASSRTALQALLRGVLGTSAMVLLIFATFWIMYDDPWTALARLRGEVITVEPAVSDVGAGVAGEERWFTVRLANRTNHDVSCIGGTASCGCAATRDLPLTLSPGESRPVQIRIYFRGGDGFFQHRFVLYTDDRNQSTVVARFAGRVVQPPG